MTRDTATRRAILMAVFVALAGCAAVTPTPDEQRVDKVGDGKTDDTTNVLAKVWDKQPQALEAASSATAAAAQPAPVETANTSAAEPVRVVRSLGVTPPEAKPGECFAKVLEPAQYRDEPYERVVRAAGERVEWTQADYQEVQEQVVVRPAYKRVEVTPAVYEEVSEQVVIRDAYRREIEVPALYDTYFEQVVERPARKVWKPGRGEQERVDEATGEILCLVEEPAVYKTVERKELKRAATKRYEDVPAEYATVVKQVVKTPEQSQEVEVPAEYTTITARKLVKPAQQVKVPVAAVKETTYRKVLMSDERYAWHQVLCEQNATTDRIDVIRSTLSGKGYGPLAKNGAIDADLTGAVSRFQADNKLSKTGLLSAETLSALGVSMQ